MKVSLNWLTDYVDVTMPAQQLGELLTSIGLVCDGIDQTDADVVFDLDVTSNRPDWLGHLGIAREIAAVTGAAFRPPQPTNLPEKGDVHKLTSVEVLDPDLCPRYTARLIRGVKIGPSPDWMIQRLAAVGLRGINNVVDVTNYVMMEYSQPLHSFDFDKLAGRRIIVRRARPGEHLVSIDQTRCTLDESMLAIADQDKAVAIAGIMGGLDTEVAAQTADVLIEAAQFDPMNIRQTSRKLRLMSESNYRFERGVDPVGVEEASRRACQLILQLAGGELAGGVADAWANPRQPRQVALRPQRCDALLGVAIPAPRQVQLLERLGLGPRMESGRIVCAIPPFRGDLAREVDLIEEIARLEGYDHIPVGRQVSHEVRPEGQAQRIRRQLSAAMAAVGFDEVQTFTFVDAAEAALMGQDQPVRVDAAARRTNNALRPTLLPSLLRACKLNQDVGQAQVNLYELASAFPPGAAGGLPAEYLELAMATTGDLPGLRGAVEGLVAQLAPSARMEVQPACAAGFDETACGKVLLDGQEAGVLGRLSQRVQDYYGLTRPVWGASLRFEELAKRAERLRLYEPLPRFPAIQRDLSVVVHEDVAWAQLRGAIEEASQPLRAGLDYVTTYRGKPVPDGRKSVTVSLTYRSDTGTLRSEQVDQQVQEVLEVLEKKLQAQLRV
jgi:phenylalanyl-tRNA synthetase beta chain